jgi:hypothetical protein
MPKRTNPFQQVIASLVDLLDDSAVVTESVEYPDPAAGNPREVDITVVTGQLNGKSLRIGIECTDLGRRATQPWVEMQYGKHSRLQVVDHVVLVSDSGFSKTALEVAKSVGYLAINPNITESELASALSDGGWILGVRATSIRCLRFEAKVTIPLPSPDGFAVIDYGEDSWFVRADGSKLVLANEFAQSAAADEYLKDPQSYAAVVDSFQTDFTFNLDSPTHESDRLYIIATDGKSEVVASVDQLLITASVVTTNTANVKHTHTGKAFGQMFASGSAPIGDTEAVIVTTEVGGAQKSQVRFNFDASKGHPKQPKARKKRSKKSK